MTFRDELQHKLALGMDKWFTGISDELPTWFHREGLFLGIGDDVGSVAVASLFDSDLRTTEADWRAKRIELGLEKRPEPGVTPKEDDAWNEKRMDAIGQNGHQPEVYGVTDVSKVDFDSSKSDGSTASYYELPEGCTELQDLISHRNLNAQDGEMFRAIYRKGRASHSDELRDAKKVLFYAQAEVDRLMKLSEGK